MLPSNKSSLRKKILQQRQAISSQDWQQKNNSLCNLLQNWSIFQEAETILAYFSFRQEIDLYSLFFLDKKWAFPRCVDSSLSWHLWQPGNSLSIDKYGIQTPQKTAPIIVPNHADLILVPCVACDRYGYRLGYGGGFYDRFFSSLESASIRTVGIVFDYALLPQLPQDPWDIPLNYICTEKQLFTIAQN